jgi:hypothetical protein
MKFLYAMSEDESVSRIADIQDRLGKPNSQIQTYRLRLIEAGVIASPRRGELEICIPYLKEYLREKKMSAIKEIKSLDNAQNPVQTKL